MLYVPHSASRNQTVLILRPSGQPDPSSPHAEVLKAHGIIAVDHACVDHRAADWRVGLVIIEHENDIRQLDRCEATIASHAVSWIGLIAQEFIATPRVRDFISEHLSNFITTPAESADIVLAIRHAWGMAYIRDQSGESDEKVSPANATDADRMMVGKTPQMQRLFSQIRKVARSDASVLITGPSGTGKELAALSVHRQSLRRQAAFVALNCGAIAPQLFQSELFGHEKGAFTGAIQRKIGRIEAAHGGTLFLDEIGDMPMEAQVNLLRFLQEKTIERVGSTEVLPVDVRVIAATHIDLADAVRQGRFREDLYYRINVVCIAIPKLADRGDDIEDIAQYYFNKFAALHNRSLRGFSKASMNKLLSHPWPGNVRELVNRVQRAVVMAEGRFIQPEDLGFDRSVDRESMMTLQDARAAAERVMIRRALSQSRNRISRAAVLLGVSRVTLYRLIDKYNIRTGTVVNAKGAMSENAAPVYQGAPANG